jgi:polyphenol oxidase
MIRWDAPPAYVVAFTTRQGGVSVGPYESLNLGLLTEDGHANVEENRRRVCAYTGADPDRMAMNRQVHGAVVNKAAAGQRGTLGDGLWTEEPGLPLLKLTADCLPVALVRTDGRPRLVLLHVGRLGLLEGIVEAGVAMPGVATAPGVATPRQKAVIGPGIGPCCYEVGTEILETYRARFGSAVIRNGHLDLPAAAELALRGAGVTKVDRIDICTACNADDFFSHRRDGGVTGRQGVIGYIA